MSQTNTTTTVTTTTAVQTGTQIVVDTSTTTTQIGNFVTDVTLQPYIAPRIVSFYAYNMRPNERLHIFFDSVNVDEYCAPSTRNGSNNYATTSLTNTADWRSIPRGGDWGSAIFSDSNGIVAGQFNIPEGVFRTGDRILQIADVDNLVLGNSAVTSVSSARFTASNLTVTRESLTQTTINPEISYVEVSNTVVTTNTTINVTVLPDIINFRASAREPLAQSLTINTPGNEPGVFATSIEIYFKQKSQLKENGVLVYLCEVNNGYPDGNNVLPFSRVHKTFDEINISENSTVATKFTFESPVFLNNGKQYAFIIKPDANDPDYFVYTANLGDVDLSTGIQVFSQPVIGIAFYGATDTQWTALQTEYVKFKLNIAAFNEQEGDVYFNNKDNEYLSVFNLAYSNTSVGILPGDIVFESTNAVINSVGGSTNSSVNGIVNYYDPLKGILYVDDSTGNFTPNTFVQVHRFSNSTISTPNSSTLIAYANTGELYNPGLDALVTQVASLVPAGTNIDYNFKGTSNTFALDSLEYRVNPGYETEFLDKERIVASRSNEVGIMGDTKSLTLRAKFTTDSALVSPAIDTVRYQQLVIKNSVDPISYEYDEYFNSGKGKSKYISKVITLATGQDAQDLRVILTAFRPVSSDVQVWVKFMNNEDPETLAQKTWLPMINTGKDVYSNPSNPNNYREYVYVVPQYYSLVPTTGNITVSNTSNTITGSGTLFESELEVGWFINMRANSSFNEVSRKIVSIANNTSLQLDAPFNGNYTAESYFLVPPITTPWLSTKSATELTGNVATSTTTNIITGTGTQFTTEIFPGSIIAINGDAQEVVSITNSTSLSVGTVWSSSGSDLKAYNSTPAGVSYLDNTLNLYTTFKQFQLKIILQSDDSSKVPIIDDLRALALQL